MQRQYADFLSDWRTDLGGSKNFHNGAGGTYDCIAIMSYYAVCRDVTSFREVEEIEENLILPTFRKLSKFVDCNKPFFKKLMYRTFQNAEKQCGTRFSLVHECGHAVVGLLLLRRQHGQHCTRHIGKVRFRGFQ